MKTPQNAANKAIIALMIVVIASNMMHPYCSCQVEIL